MRRAPLLPVAAAALALAGCPIPQALPEYTATSVPPPRILVDDQLAPRSGDFQGAVTLVPAGCPVAPAQVLSARIVDNDTVESVEARWFVNYDHRDPAWSEIRRSDVIPPNADPTRLERTVPPWTFEPYRYPPPYGTPALTGPPYRDAGVLRVVELVVSNGFDPGAVGTVEAAHRSPKVAFETTVYRWVFLTVPESTAVPCPP